MTAFHRSDANAAQPSFRLRGLIRAACAVLSLVLVAGAGCKSDDSAKSASNDSTSRATPVAVSVLVKGKPFRLQVRSTEKSRFNAVGNFPVQSEADGVLLVHPIIRPAHVYYYGAPMALEAICLDDTGRILAVETVVPDFGEETQGRARYFGRQAARYVMLLPGGMFREAGGRQGDTLIIPPAATKAMNDSLVPLKIRAENFKLEVVATNTGRSQGLMRVPALPHDVGMVFVFRDDQDQAFWMRNTMIPLDIAYVNSAGVVVSLKTMQPFDERGVPSLGPARFAIELAAGTASRLGLRAGDKLELPPSITNPPDLE